MEYSEHNPKYCPMFPMGCLYLQISWLRHQTLNLMQYDIANKTSSFYYDVMSCFNNIVKLSLNCEPNF